MLHTKNIGILFKSNKIKRIKFKTIFFRKKKNFNFKNDVYSKRTKTHKFTIGSVLIILSIKFQGKKAVLLKITKAGFLVISGPRNINGISLRRINPKHAISTEIRIDISRIDLKIFNDTYFNTLGNKSNNNSYSQREILIYSHKVRSLYVDQYLKNQIVQFFFLRYYIKTKSKNIIKNV